MIDSFALLAYVDPGVGSLLLQALVGGSAGMVVFGRYLWQTYITPATIRRS
jgi:hypothetical protein